MISAVLVSFPMLAPRSEVSAVTRATKPADRTERQAAILESLVQKCATEAKGCLGPRI